MNALKTEDYVIFKFAFMHEYSICPLFTCKQRCLLKVNTNILKMNDLCFNLTTAYELRYVTGQT